MNTKKAAEKRTVRLQADLEATDTTWWEAAYSAPKPALSRRVVAWIDDPDEDLYLTPAEARAFEAWASTLPGYETGVPSAPHPFLLHRADPRDYRPAIVKILDRAAVPGEDLEQAVMAGAPAVINGDEALRIADWLARRANVEWSPDPRHAAIAAEIRAAVLDGE